MEHYYITVTDGGKTVAERRVSDITPALVGSLPNGTITVLRVVARAQKTEAPPKEDPKISDADWTKIHHTSLAAKLMPPKKIEAKSEAKVEEKKETTADPGPALRAIAKAKKGASK